MEKNDLPDNISNPAKRALSNAGIGSLRELSAFSEKDIAALHGIGPNAMAKLKQALAGKGLGFARGK